MGRSSFARDGECGAALIEFAFVAPLLLLLLFGIVEFGFAFRTQLTVANATQSAGRVAATLGTNTSADHAVLQSIADSLGSLSGLEIVQEVDIWESDGSGEPVGSCPGPSCNTYTYHPGFWSSPPCDWEPCPDLDNGGTLGGGWGFTTAERDVVLDDDGLGLVGVTVYFRHHWLTGLMPVGDVACASPPANCWHNTAIFRFEPLLFEDSS